MKSIVTRESLTQLLEGPRKVDVIGRALVALFERQTQSEKATNDTNVWNNVGFAGADARSGSLTAKYYIKHRSLLDWQVQMWLKPNRKGQPRLVKYWRQLNEVANEKAAA